MKSLIVVAVALIASSFAVPVLNQPAVTAELQARIDALSFLYDNVLSDLFSGLVSNTFNQISSTLLNLIQTNPLGVGKRSVGDDLVARVDALSFLYDNVFADLFSGLVSNTFNQISSTLLNLIQTNPLGIGKRSAVDFAARVDPLSFLYDNVFADLFSGLVSNTFNHISSTLLNLIQTNPLGVGKRSIDLQQIQNLFAPIASKLIEKLKSLLHQAPTMLKDPTKIAQFLLGIVAEIKLAFTTLAQQLSPVIPTSLTDQVSHILAAAQSTLVYFASGLAGSLGPVIGPFRP